MTRAQASISGVLAAGAALAAGELVCGLRGDGPTLVTAVGTQFIDRFAASLKDLAVAVFGTNDKPALIVGIVVISLALGALLGRLATRQPLLAAAGFAAFGLIGLLSYLDDPQGDPLTGWLAALASVAVGLAVLFALLRLADRPVPSDDVEMEPAPASSSGSRRTFLLAGMVSAIGAVGAAALGRRLGSTDVVNAARENTRLPPSQPVSPPGTAGGPAGGGSLAGSFDVPGLTPYVTPNADFFRIDTALRTPQVDVADWSLRIDGMVDRPLELTYDELVAMATAEDTVTLQCVSNEVGGNLVGNAVWQGVPLADLLERVGVQAGATQVVGRSVDDFTAGFPTEVLDGRTALVAVAMNGEPLPAEHGFPARLVVAGLYGYVSATKWLRQIELTTWEGFDGYWVPRGWSKEGPIKTMSRIDVPRSGASLMPGAQAVAGVAWAPPIGIARVEVQIGEDGEWQEAELGDATSGNTWVQWKHAWDAAPGEYRIRVRATGTDGVTQTEDSAPPAPDGATGWHRRTVRVMAP